MNTDEILRNCRELPGVSVVTANGCRELLLASAEGDGRMLFVPLFPGITLAYITVHAPSWPAPRPSHCTPDARGPLIINYCLRGRCELVLNDNKSVFLTAGQISLTERFAQNAYLYPGRLYEGLELFIDPETIANGLPVLADTFSLDISNLSDRYCPDGTTFIAKTRLPNALAERLQALSDSGDRMATVGMQTGVIELFAWLLYGLPALKTERPVYYTKSQVEIAKRTEALLTADLSKSHTVRECAEHFSVSESSIKNYFFGVFGQSISQYVTHRRMDEAARLLAETRLSVIEVAARVGYANQSKFAAAFRRAFACSPLEYRRKTNIP